MEHDAQATFQELTLDTPEFAWPDAVLDPSHSRDNDTDQIDREGDKTNWFHKDKPDLSNTAPRSAVAAGTSVNHYAYLDDDNHATTPPIDMPASAVSLEHPTDNNYALIESRHCDTPSLEQFMQNRRPSISFNPVVTLESGHRRVLDDSLPKLHITTRPRGRSLLKELSNELPSPRPLQQNNNGAEKDHYEPLLDESLKISDQSAEPGSYLNSPHPRHKYSPFLSNFQPFASDKELTNLERDASLTSGSTASPITEEACTPPNETMECLSPISTYSPFHHPISLEESSAWPNTKRRQDSVRAKSYNFDPNGNFRQRRRQNSRRSNSSATPISPAAGFLSKWAREEREPEPDDEGQEVGDFVLGKQVGFGGFSIVREAFSLERGERKRSAVKIVRKQVAGRDELTNEQLQAEFEHEVGLWRCLSHRHILPLLAVYVTDFATFCFMELNTGGTLFDLVRANRQGIPRDLARRYSYQLASAIRYLHEDVRVVHRDLKLENCLIDMSGPNAAVQGGKLLLCDFGLADFVTSDLSTGTSDLYENLDGESKQNQGHQGISNTIAGSLQYASPELILSPAGFLSPVVDMWAFGVIVYALMVGGLPFQHMLQPRVQTMILAGDWNAEALRTAKGAIGDEEEASELVRGCLEKQCAERWTIAQVLESRWLNGCEEMLAEIHDDWQG